MKPTALVVLAAVVCTGGAIRASAQFGGLPSFKRPNIANIFHPVLGAGGAYEETDQQGRKSQLEMSIVGKETVGTQEAFWMEVGHASDGSGTPMYAKMLVTPTDFAFHKMVFVMPGTAQPMEMDMDATKMHRETIEKDMAKWHSVGVETITVPAGSFSCEHWTKDEGKGDVWVTSKVSPMGMVKLVDEHDTMVLVKQINDARTHISGTPVRFDPQMMMRQRMGQQAAAQP